jgi:hypothetical protein
MPGKKMLLTAVSLALVPLMAFSQDKAGGTSAPASAASAQAAGSSAGAAATNDAKGAGAAANADKQDKQGKQKAGASVAPILLLVPINAPEHTQWKKKGCWAKFYDDQNYAGDNLTLLGPVDMPDMTGPFGIDWKGKISSVETGPHARVLVYDNENFKDLVATFKPGQKSADVSKKMGFFDEFSSLKITCDKAKAKGAGKSEADGAGKS